MSRPLPAVAHSAGAASLTLLVSLSRRYPPELSGPRYPEGLPIWPEDDLESVIRDERVDRCMLAYSDLHHHRVMELAARCLAAGCEFFLVPPSRTMLPSTKPTVAVVAVRTGCVS